MPLVVTLAMVLMTVRIGIPPWLAPRSRRTGTNEWSSGGGNQLGRHRYSTREFNGYRPAKLPFASSEWKYYRAFGAAATHFRAFGCRCEARSPHRGAGSRKGSRCG